MTLEIRAARREDIGAIVDLLQRDSLGRAREDGNDREAYLRAFESMAADPNNELVVASRDGEVIGTLQLTFVPGLSFRGAWRAEVEGVRVREDLRNLRIGTQLMDWVIARARERGCRMVQLTTNVARTDAQRFYKRLGFEASHVGMKLYL